MDLKLTDKTALVTGASQGIGFAGAKALADEGCLVTIAARDENKLHNSAKTIEDSCGKRPTCERVDLSDSASTAKLTKKYAGSKQDIDILVICTGHPSMPHFLDSTAEDWQAGQDLLLRPVVELCQAFLPAMRANKFGRIVAIGSIYGLESEESSVIQSTYRKALLGLIKCIARDNAAYGIGANVICPGWFDTPLVHGLADETGTKEKRSVKDVLDEWQQVPPAKRFGTMDEMGALVAYLSSPVSSFINGTQITIDGAQLRSI
ncbi:MAG: SDR family oxidoreductase [Gammaproteobacteria bacterium]|nr:SDR family oxidoreductase [Gammaproteobacteria bacterium]